MRSKKGSFSLELGVHPRYRMEGDLRRNTGRTIIIKDTNAQNDYRVNSPAGEFGILSASSVQTSGAIAHGLTTGSNWPTKAKQHRSDILSSRYCCFRC